MKKRILALAACLLLTVQLAASPAEAVRQVYFVAAEENVQPLTEATMPFWQGGYLYISSTVFSGITRKALGVGQITNKTKQLVTLYDGGMVLRFEVGKSYGEDSEGNLHYPGVVERNGNYFVPASLVAKYFGLQYSVTEVNHGYLVWIRKPGSVLTDRVFADAASGPMNSRYNDYLKSAEAAVKVPVKEEPAVPTPQEPAVSRQMRAYLCLEAGDTAETILNTLDDYDSKAAFFCTPAFLEKQGGLLRRMVATGHSVAILADAADRTQTVEEQLEAGNRALEAATCSRTRLAMIRSGSNAAREAAQNAGYRCLLPELDRSDSSLKNAGDAAQLLNRISSQDGDVTVWLGDTAGAVGLRAFLFAFRNADGECLALTETT